METGQTPKPNFNSYFGELELISAHHKLNKPVTGWWHTFKWMDMDLHCTLPVGYKVAVWFSAKQQTYIIATEKIMDCAFTKNVTVLFTADIAIN